MNKFQIIHAWKNQEFRDGMCYRGLDGEERAIVTLYEDRDIVEYDWNRRRPYEKYRICSLDEFALWAEWKVTKNWKFAKKEETKDAEWS